MLDKIQKLLGKEADSLLKHKAIFPKEQLNLPGPDFIDRVHIQSDRSPNVLKNLSWILKLRSRKYS
jgi:class I fructose-bisphosphate aldolase